MLDDLNYKNNKSSWQLKQCNVLRLYSQAPLPLFSKISYDAALVESINIESCFVHDNICTNNYA